jgi:hypothetical protein
MKTSRETAARAICLGAIDFRARFEGVRFADQVEAGELDNARCMVEGVTSWVRDSGVWSFLIAPERALLSVEAMTWERYIVEDVQRARLTESVGTLLGMLNMFRAMPAYDDRFDAQQVLHLLPFLSDSPFVTRKDMPPDEEWESMAGSVTLVVPEGIAFEEACAGLWWWRAVSESLVRSGRMTREKLDQILAEGAPHSRRFGVELTDNDFTVFGKGYRHVDTREHAYASAIAEARLRALRWILGDVAWDEVPMDS